MILRALRLHLTRLRILYGSAILFLLFVLLVITVVFMPPREFPVGIIVSIPSGVSAREGVALLYEKHVISHPELFLAWISLTGKDESIKFGDYIFERPLALYDIASRITSGDFGNIHVRLTVPEGSRVKDISLLIEKILPHLDAHVFELMARSQEGYLFPDTYDLLPNTTHQDIIDMMRARFDEQIQTIQVEIQKSGEPLSRIVTMASLLEREARQLETMQMISGILWRRIDIGMALQVDAVFGYIFDRPTYSPSFDDLKVDSPYNTYTNRDLPPGPIGNPGIDALKAAVTPTKNPYLFYLTGQDGNMYYAKTFEEHKRNRARYLD